MKLDVYCHYKNKSYEVIGVAKNSDDLTDYVVYKTLYQNDISDLWLRRLEEFNEMVVVDGVKVPRFTFISEKQ